MWNEKLERALNEQINREFFSSYLYLSMAQWFESGNWKGFSHWMRIQAKEEHAHAMRIIRFINERGGRVTLGRIDAPQTEWSGPIAAIEDAHGHEQSITKCIHDILTMARNESDYATESFLKWFVDEQVEEEARAREILDALQKIGDAKGALFMLDHQLAKREG